jgi:hypothetical protein
MINKTMSKPFTIQKFIESANKKFNSKFNYSMVYYKNANTNVTILCPTHGEFSTTPWNHISRKHGCPKCGTDAMAKQQRDKSAAKLKEYIESGITNYDYSLATINKITDKIIVICKEHGEFSVTADHHIRGVGCKKCADQNKVGGYNELWFNFDPTRKDIPGVLYVLEMYSETERFIKVGITKHSVSKRYAGAKFKYNILTLWYSSLYECYQKEKELKENFYNHRYKNTHKTYITESFSVIAKDDILSYIPKF